MTPLFHFAQQVQQFMDGRAWRFCFIGGVALQRWGEPRLTQDIDLILFTGFGEEEAFIHELCRAWPSRIPDAEDFALRNRVLLLRSDSGTGMDISLGGLPYEEEVIARASRFRFLPDVDLFTCSAEDLIVLKAFADRTQDWADVESVIARQSTANLDWSHVDRWLELLCELKEAPEIPRRLERLRQGL